MIEREVKAVTPAELAPGMRLAEDLADEQGRTLLAAGTVLDEKLIGRLQGVNTVARVWPPVDEQAVSERLERQYRRFAGQTQMVALAAMMRRYHFGGGHG